MSGDRGPSSAISSRVLIMVKFNWLKWFLYFVIALLAPEVLKVVVAKANIPAGYLISIILLCLQTLLALAFIYYALFANIFRKKLNRRRLVAWFSISFFSFIVLLELLFTSWLYHPSRIPSGLRWSYKYYYDVYNFRILQYERNAIRFDNELLYTLKPGAAIEFSNAEFKTAVRVNKFGFRDDDSSAVAPEIICLGDSFTMGWGLDESQSFPGIIEKSTGKKVLNTGTPSYGTARELLLLERLDTSRLKYIIIQYCANDKDENLSFIGNNYKLDLTPLPVFKSTMNAYELSRKYFPGKNFLLISQLWMKQQLNKVYPIFKLSGQPYNEEFDSREHASVFLEVLMKFRQRFGNVKFIVTDVDISKYRNNTFIEELHHQTAALGVEERKNIIFVNSAKDLTDKDYFLLDYHIRSSGHEKVAASLIQAIKENP